MIASRTGTRLSSVWPDHLCSQTKPNAQTQPWRHTNCKCTCYYWTYFSYYCDYCAFLCSHQAQYTRCRSRNNGYEEQGWPQECQSRLWRLHKGCKHVNSCPISLIIADYCHYLNNYCNYLQTQNCDLDRYFMWKSVQEAQESGPHSNHSSSGTTKSPCPIPPS